MAKKDEVEEVEEEVEGEESEEAAAKAVEAAAQKKKFILLAVIGVVLLLVAGGGTWLALRMLSSKEEPAAEVATEQATAPEGNKEEVKEKEKSEKPAHKDAMYDVLDPPFLANYQVAGRTHYLQMSLAVMARDQAAMDAVAAHMPLLRNRIVMLLSGEVFEQLQSDEGRVQLQQKLLAAIQEILQKETGKPQIEQVFFTNFVMQ